MHFSFRDPVSAITHLTGALAAMIGAAVLISASSLRPAALAALVVYGASLVLLFLSSGIYHALRVPPHAQQALRRLDHSAIYLLIAGTYTPFCVLAFTGFWRWGLLGFIWLLALGGIVAKIWVLDAPRALTAGLYVGMGWISILAVRQMLVALPAASLGWLVAGGVIYTAGALVYASKKLDFRPGVFGFHEVWHMFVLLGAAAHFLAVYSLVRAPFV